MEIEIIELYTKNSILNVVVKTPYGQKRLGLGLHTLDLDPETDKPKWMREVRNKLEEQFGTTKVKQKRYIDCDIIKQKIKLNELSPSDSEIMKNINKKEQIPANEYKPGRK